VEIDRLHGKSLIPLMNGKKEMIHDMIVSSFPLTHGTPSLDKSTITTEEWSLHVCGLSQDPGAERLPPTDLPYGKEPSHYRPGEKKAALFHLPSDPAQKHDVISDKAVVAKELHTQYVSSLEAWGLSEDRLKLNRTLTIAG